MMLFNIFHQALIVIFSMYVIYLCILQVIFKFAPVGQVKYKKCISRNANYKVVIIPCLREQKVINKTLIHFYNQIKQYNDKTIKIIVVTSDREEYDKESLLNSVNSFDLKESRFKKWCFFISLRKYGLDKNLKEYVKLYLQNIISFDEFKVFSSRVETTNALCKKKIDILNKSIGYNAFNILNYPYANGMMADQVNWAARNVFQYIEEYVELERVVFTIYNADSRPDYKSIVDFVDSKMYKCDNIYQQYSLYECRDECKSFNNILMNAAALWQNRWTLFVEIPRSYICNRLLAQIRKTDRIIIKNFLWLFVPNSYVIGHGLTVSAKLFIQYNYLPTVLYNEDAALSYLLLSDSKCPVSLKGYDTSEVPSGISELLFQQASWFNGPASFHKYATYTKKMIGGNNKYIYFKTFLDTITWFLGPALIFSTISYSPNHDFTVPMVVFFLYLYLPLVHTVILSKKKLLKINYWIGLIAMPMFYFLHGIAPLVHLFLKISPGTSKHKTER